MSQFAQGQTIFDVADSSILRYLEELKKNNKRCKRRPASQIRISDGLDNHIDTTPSKVIRVDGKSTGSSDAKDVDGRLGGKVMLRSERDRN